MHKAFQLRAKLRPRTKGGPALKGQALQRVDGGGRGSSVVADGRRVAAGRRAGVCAATSQPQPCALVRGRGRQREHGQAVVERCAIDHAPVSRGTHRADALDAPRCGNGVALFAVCCIFHKPKAFGESDSESDSHDSSSSDSSSDESDAYDSDDEWRRQMRAPPPGGENGAAAAAADPGRPGPAGSEDSAHGDAAGDGAPVHE